jgi:outer membrane lipoprotein-sorting protein
MRYLRVAAVSASVAVFLLLSILPATPEELSGRQIIEKEEQLNKGADEFNHMSMRLINSRGQERKRRVEYYRKTVEGDNDRILMRFLEPADVKGVGLLTVEQPDRDDDQWLYLPALKKSRRISSSDQTDNFMGTDFTYEDIRSEKLDRHNYTVVGKEAIEGCDCYVIEAVPADEAQKKESGYSRRQLWVRKDIYLTVQVKYYDRRGEFFKMEILKDIIEVAPNIYRPNFMEMKNLKTNHTTQLTFDGRRINEGLDDKIFTERELIRG